MALEYCCSDVIIRKGDQNATYRSNIDPKANCFRIYRRKFIQARSNPEPIPGGYNKFPKGSNKVEVTAQKRYGYIEYDVAFVDSKGNNLKTYSF